MTTARSLLTLDCQSAVWSHMASEHHSAGGSIFAVYLSLIGRLRLPYSCEGERYTHAGMDAFLCPTDDLLWWHDDRGRADASTRLMFSTADGALVYLFLSRTAHSTFTLAAPTKVTRDTVWQRILDAAAPAPARVGDRIRVQFLLNRGNSGELKGRRLACPTWAEIADNYAPRVREQMQQQVTHRPDPTQGRVLILHGPPGTGKTFMLRALAREWVTQYRANIVYLVDPETFFGNAGYMMGGLLALNSDGLGVADTLDNLDLDDDEDERRSGSVPGPQILLIEDADELLSIDAKARSGQAVSRLLNLADGFLGQGTDLYIVLTTNEVIHNFHPALTRAGRCRAIIEVPLFTQADAHAWLAAHQYPGDTYPTGAQSLAALYRALREPDATPSERGARAVGFSHS